MRPPAAGVRVRELIAFRLPEYRVVMQALSGTLPPATHPAKLEFCHPFIPERNAIAGGLLAIGVHTAGNVARRPFMARGISQRDKVHKVGLAGELFDMDTRAGNGSATHPRKAALTIPRRPIRIEKRVTCYGMDKPRSGARSGPGYGTRRRDWVN